MAHLLHGLGNEGTDLLVAGRHRAHAGDVGAAVDLLGVVLHGSHGGLNGLGDALLHDDGVGAGGQVLQALVNDGLGQQSGGGGAVAGHVVGLGGDFLHQLGAHVLKGVLQLDLLGDGHAVVGDEGSAELLVQHHIAALGAQSDLNGIGQLVDAGLQSLAGLVAPLDQLRHNQLPPKNFIFVSQR